MEENNQKTSSISLRAYKELQDELRYLEKIQILREIEMNEKSLMLSFISARYEKHMTQVQLAKKLGMKQEFISRLESGRSNPRYRTMFKVAKALDKKIILI